MRKNELRKTQANALKRMTRGVNYSAFDLGCSIATLQSMARKGFIKHMNPGALGEIFLPRTTSKFCKEKENDGTG